MVDDGSAGWRELVPAPEAVAASRGETYFSVRRQGWAAARPDLPPEVTDLVAPPIVVRAAPTRPAGAHVPAPAVPPPATVADCPVTVAPSAPSAPAPARTGRTGPAAGRPATRTTSGRHRRAVATS